MRPVPLLRSGLTPACPTAPPAAKKLDQRTLPGWLSRHPERQRSTRALLPKPQATRVPSPHGHILSEPTREPPGRIPAHLLHRPLPNLSAGSRGGFCSPHRACSARRKSRFRRSHRACAHPRGPPRVCTGHTAPAHTPRPPSSPHRALVWSQGTAQARLRLPLLLAGLAGVAALV